MSREAPDTDRLCDLCSRGDAVSREQLLARHRSRLKRMVQPYLDFRLAGRLDASDVVQETLVTAARRLPDYLRHRPLPFFPWLRQIALDRLAEIHRRHIQARRRSVLRETPWRHGEIGGAAGDLAAALSGVSSPSSCVLRQERIERVRSAINDLPAADRLLIVLRHIEQLPLREIATIVGGTEGAVRTRHFRILRRLHDQLADGEGA